MSQDQKDKCFLFVNKAADGRVTFDEFVQCVPGFSLTASMDLIWMRCSGMEELRDCNFEPELTDDQLDMLKPTLRTDIEWTHIGTVTNEDPGTLFELMGEVGKGAFGSVFKGCAALQLLIVC